MRVFVRVRGDEHIRRELLDNDTERTLDLPEGSPASALSSQLGSNLWQIGAVAVNGAVVGQDHPLHDGDRVEVIIAMVGG